MTMNNQKTNSVILLNLLKEIGKLGSEKAAGALGQFLNCEVEMSVPEVKVIPLEALSTLLGNHEDLYFVMDVELRGDIEGRTIFFLSPQEAKNMGAILLKKKHAEINRDDPLFQSALSEAMNIISGAYTNVLADKTHTRIMRSPPSLAIDMVGAVLDFLYSYFNSRTSDVFFIKTELKVKNTPIEGFFIFFPRREPLQKVLELFEEK